MTSGGGRGGIGATLNSPGQYCSSYGSGTLADSLIATAVGGQGYMSSDTYTGVITAHAGSGSPHSRVGGFGGGGGSLYEGGGGGGYGPGSYPSEVNTYTTTYPNYGAISKISSLGTSQTDLGLNGTFQSQGVVGPSVLHGYVTVTRN